MKWVTAPLSLTELRHNSTIKTIWGLCGGSTVNSTALRDRYSAASKNRCVTQAAAQLQIGQPAMSASLNRLRILFDDPLFVRLGRQMQPTLKAQAITPSILAALQQIRHSLAPSQAFDPSLGDRTFAIGSSDYTSFVLLPPLLELCRQTSPGLNFQMIGFEKDSVGELLEQD